jgi:hypothetical protein
LELVHDEAGERRAGELALGQECREVPAQDRVQRAAARIERARVLRHARRRTPAAVRF